MRRYIGQLKILKYEDLNYEVFVQVVTESLYQFSPYVTVLDKGLVGNPPLQLCAPPRSVRAPPNPSQRSVRSCVHARAPRAKTLHVRREAQSAINVVVKQ